MLVITRILNRSRRVYITRVFVTLGLSVILIHGVRSMAAPSIIPLPAPLRTGGNLALEWKRFKGQWKNYTKAAKIDREDEDRPGM